MYGIHDDPAKKFAVMALTENEAAEYIGMSTSYLRQSRCQGEKSRPVAGPPFVKIGRSVRYLPSELNKWLNEQPRGV